MLRSHPDTDSGVSDPSTRPLSSRRDPPPGGTGTGTRRGRNTATSMNLWIVLAITWIGVSVVIADSRWFVQETPLPGEDSDAQLFSSEDLIPVDKKPPPPAAKPTPVKIAPPSQPVPSQKVVVVEQHGADRARVGRDESHISEVKEEGLLLVNPAGRKPLQADLTTDTPTTPQPKTETKSGTKAEWFVQDSSSQEVEDRDGLFPSENLIRVYAANTKQAPAGPASGVTQHTVKTKPVNAEKKTISKEVAPSIVKDAEKLEFIPHQSAGRKLLDTAEETSNPVPTVEKPRPNILGSSRNVASWFAFSTSDTVEKEGEDDLFEEHYMRVATKQTKHPGGKDTKDKPKQVDKKTEQKQEPTQQQKKSVKPTPKVVKTDGLTTGETTAAVRKPLQVLQKDPEPARQQQEQQQEDAPCDPEKDMDCLMADEDFIPVKKSPPRPPQPPRPPPPDLIKHPPQNKGVPQGGNPEPVKVTEKKISRESLHRRLLDNERDVKPRERRAVLTPMESEEELEELEGLEELEEEEVLGLEDTPLRRYVRQTAGDESGDGGFDGETGISNSTHNVAFQTVMNTTMQPLQLTEEEKQSITLEFVRQTQDKFQNSSIFKDVIVKNVTLDSNGRVVIDWELVLSISAAPGNNQQERVQSSLSFINGTVIPFVNNDLTVGGQPVYEPLNENVVLGIAESVLGDACQVQDACPEGYVCISAESICRHLCYHNNFFEQCRHGSTCQLNDQYQPYCQCGSGYTGEFCETPVSDPQYSNGQVVGAGVAGAVATVGVVGSVVYVAMFRKKKEEDMRYSYFGDDDAPMAAYSDPGSNLGMDNGQFTIARPSLITPMDLYHQDQALA